MVRVKFVGMKDNKLSQQERDALVTMACGLLGWCECGNAETGIIQCLGVLISINNNSDSALFHEENNPAIMHFLESAGMISHGGSLFSSFVTDKGRKLISIGEKL